MTCPKCGGNRVRIRLSLFIDAPVAFYARATKKALRDSAVKIEGADWGRARFYCPCGEFYFIPEGEKEERPC